MDHLAERLACLAVVAYGACSWLDEQAGQDLAHVVETRRAGLRDLDQAHLLLIFPDSSRAILGAAEERRVLRVQVDGRDLVGVAHKAAQDVVVMQRPVHDTVILLALAGAEDALVVVREPDMVDSVALVVVRVDLVASL